MTDVISHILIFEIDPAGGLIGVGSCLLQRLACGSDAQHPAAIGDDLAVLELGSRVEYEKTILILDLLQTVDLEALLVRYRVSVGCSTTQTAALSSNSSSI